MFGTVIVGLFALGFLNNLRRWRELRGFKLNYFINLVFALYSFTKLNSYVKFVAIIPKISLELENTESSEELAEVKAEEREEEASSETES